MIADLPPLGTSSPENGGAIPFSPEWVGARKGRRLKSAVFIYRAFLLRSQDFGSPLMRDTPSLYARRCAVVRVPFSSSSIEHSKLDV